MNPSFKKILLIALLFIVAGGIAYGLYYMFTKINIVTQSLSGQPQLPTTTGQLPSSGISPATTTGQITQPSKLTPSTGTFQPVPSGYYKPSAVSKVVSDVVSSPSLAQSGSFRYYNANDGKFYRLGTNGQVIALSDKIFYNVSNITWAPNNDKAVLEYPDSSKIVYNFETQKQATLPKHWQDFSFSSDGSQIAAKNMALAPESRYIVTVNDDGTGTRLIEPMGNNADKVTMDWSPSQQVVAFSQTGDPLGGERRNILLIGLNGENFKSLVVEGSGFMPEWSPTGKKLLYSIYSSRTDFKPELWISSAYGDEIGANRQALQINTWANKCAFGSEDVLYCAVPRDLQQGAGMAPEIATGAPDDLYKIDLKTGLKTPISLGGDYTVKDISYDSAENKVIFTDANQNGVFEAKL